MLNSSVKAEYGEEGSVPPKAKADVLSAPAPAGKILPVFKAATDVQLVPFQDSVPAGT